ncbi:MAG TPA: hypothetical protein VFN90_01385 [Gemmatimonadales bacterium]|nr:hypothetical protein [Gemmatimonadales bacterium]
MSNPNDRSKSSPDGRSNATPAGPRGMQDVEDAVKAAEAAKKDAAKQGAPGAASTDPAHKPVTDHSAPSRK